VAELAGVFLKQLALSSPSSDSGEQPVWFYSLGPIIVQQPVLIVDTVFKYLVFIYMHRWRDERIPALNFLILL
jgi:hypothetical protein